uniref:Uncharacterized protein n=1 Tax=Branchiostoma floridae TaxID=7739 RepID=C3YWD0_BRAFL|eukprot:XP_002599162.1 hypothetical protein BRAFLDRAFT_68760 [Branchiostoma floridae]
MDTFDNYNVIGAPIPRQTFCHAGRCVDRPHEEAAKNLDRNPGLETPRGGVSLISLMRGFPQWLTAPTITSPIPPDYNDRVCGKYRTIMLFSCKWALPISGNIQGLPFSKEGRDWELEPWRKEVSQSCELFKLLIKVIRAFNTLVAATIQRLGDLEVRTVKQTVWQGLDTGHCCGLTRELIPFLHRCHRNPGLYCGQASSGLFTTVFSYSQL